MNNYMNKACMLFIGHAIIPGQPVYALNGCGFSNPPSSNPLPSNAVVIIFSESGREIIFPQSGMSVQDAYQAASMRIISSSHPKASATLSIWEANPAEMILLRGLPRIRHDLDDVIQSQMKLNHAALCFKQN